MSNPTHVDPVTGITWDSYGRYYNTATQQWEYPPAAQTSVPLQYPSSTTTSTGPYYPPTTTYPTTSGYYYPPQYATSDGGSALPKAIPASINCEYEGCTARCRTTVEMARHVREQHGQGPRFFCGDCNPGPRGFQRRDQLNSHQKSSGHSTRYELPLQQQ